MRMAPMKDLGRKTPQWSRAITPTTGSKGRWRSERVAPLAEIDGSMDVCPDCIESYPDALITDTPSSAVQEDHCDE